VWERLYNEVAVSHLSVVYRNLPVVTEENYKHLPEDSPRPESVFESRAHKYEDLRTTRSQNSANCMADKVSLNKPRNSQEITSIFH
jgi:hypothetical protein